MVLANCLNDPYLILRGFRNHTSNCVASFLYDFSTNANVGNLLHLAQKPNKTGDSMNSSVRETRAHFVQMLYTFLLERLQM
jgi:hypothetical protein